ncbi:MAG TPA: hypothetical protein VF226_21565 [Hyphomicrobiaceae bacterium]|jgi:hypothetical protein
MIKLLALGVWITAVTIASSFAALSWKTGQLPRPGPLGLFEELTTINTRLISIPFIADGAVQGYVVTKLAFAVDTALLKQFSVEPELVLVDEAIRTIYSSSDFDFRQMARQDLSRLAKTLAKNANERFKANLVAEVFIQELNYVTKDMVRNGGNR